MYCKTITQHIYLHSCLVVFVGLVDVLFQDGYAFGFWISGRYREGWPCLQILIISNWKRYTLVNKTCIFPQGLLREATEFVTDAALEKAATVICRTGLTATESSLRGLLQVRASKCWVILICHNSNVRFSIWHIYISMYIYICVYICIYMVFILSRARVHIHMGIKLNHRSTQTTSHVVLWYGIV